MKGVLNDLLGFVSGANLSFRLERGSIGGPMFGTRRVRGCLSSLAAPTERVWVDREDKGEGSSEALIVVLVLGFGTLCLFFDDIELEPA